MRQKLIDAIIELSGDELQETHNLIQLARETDEQLIDRIISIAQYYQEYYN